MNHLIRKSPGKEQQEVIFQSSLTLLPPQAGKAGAMVFAGWVLQCMALGEQGAVGAVPGQWAWAPQPSSASAQQAQQLLPSLSALAAVPAQPHVCHRQSPGSCLCKHCCLSLGHEMPFWCGGVYPDCFISTAFLYNSILSTAKHAFSSDLEAVL